MQPSEYETPAGRALAEAINALSERVDAFVAEVETHSSADPHPVCRDAVALAFDGPIPLAMMAHLLIEAHFGTSEQVLEAIRDLSDYIDDDLPMKAALAVHATRIAALGAVSASAQAAGVATGPPAPGVH